MCHSAALFSQNLIYKSLFHGLESNKRLSTSKDGEAV